MKIFRALLVLIIILGLSGFVFAEETKLDKDYLTKGEAVQYLSATDFMKQKMGQLISWTVGYDLTKVNRSNLTPIVNYIKVTPKIVPPDGRTIFEVFASVDDPGGIANIQGVRADLSSIGRLSETVLVDNGLFGDAKANDGVYSLQTSVPDAVDLGQKEVAITIANKKGWLALVKANVEVEKNPLILNASFKPSAALADGRSQVELTIKVDNPGRPTDIKEVTADLRPLGYKDLLVFSRQAGASVDKTNDFSLSFTVPAYVQPGEYSIRVGVLNSYSGYATKDIKLKVYKK